MSTHAWKPGDVALAKYPGEAPKVYLYVDTKFSSHGPRWESANGSHSYAFDAAEWWRFLVVIDPEDREQVEQLLLARWRAGGWGTDNGDGPSPGVIDEWQATLREVLKSKLQIAEPTGLGAVVIDSKGDDWHRTRDGRWIAEDGLRSRASGWDHIDAVAVLSEGVEQLADWEIELIRGEAR